MSKKLTTLALAVFIALAVAILGTAPAAQAQTPSTNPPYNTDLGAVITNSLRTAGTVSSSQQDNLDKVGVVCTMLQTAVSGSPSTTFSIEGYDAATNSYYAMATTGAITTSTSNVYTLWVQPGLIAADVPSNGVGKSTHLPRKWRVSQTVGGTGGPATTSKIGCNLLR